MLKTVQESKYLSSLRCDVECVMGCSSYAYLEGFTVGSQLGCGTVLLG